MAAVPVFTGRWNDHAAGPVAGNRRERGHLFGLHWIFSWWAIAWLRIARHRGLTEVFEPKNRKTFSEWVPVAMIETSDPPVPL